MKSSIYRNFYLYIALIISITAFTYGQNQQPKVNPEIWVRPGYELSIAVSSDIRARHMALGPDGTLYYTTTPEKIIVAAKDKDNDGFYETLTHFYTSENSVSDVLWNDGYLWYTESGAIYKLNR